MELYAQQTKKQYLQIQKAVSAYTKSKQILPFSFVS